MAEVEEKYRPVSSVQLFVPIKRSFVRDKRIRQLSGRAIPKKHPAKPLASFRIQTCSLVLVRCTQPDGVGTMQLTSFSRLSYIRTNVPQDRKAACHAHLNYTGKLLLDVKLRFRSRADMTALVLWWPSWLCPV